LYALLSACCKQEKNHERIYSAHGPTQNHHLPRKYHTFRMQSATPNESRLTVLCETLKVTTETKEGDAVLPVVDVEEWKVGNWVRHQMAEITKDEASTVNKKRMRAEAMPQTEEAVFSEANWQTTIDGDPKNLLLGDNAMTLCIALTRLVDYCELTQRISRDLCADLAGRLAAMAPVAFLPPTFWDGRPRTFATYLAELPDMLTKLGMGAAANHETPKIPFLGAFNTARAVKTNVVDMTYADKIGAAMHESTATCVVVHGVSGSGKSTSMALAAYCMRSLEGASCSPFVIYLCANQMEKLEEELAALDASARNAKALAFVEEQLLLLMPQSVRALKRDLSEVKYVAVIVIDELGCYPTFVRAICALHYVPEMPTATDKESTATQELAVVGSGPSDCDEKLLICGIIAKKLCVSEVRFVLGGTGCERPDLAPGSQAASFTLIHVQTALWPALALSNSKVKVFFDAMEATSAIPPKSTPASGCIDGDESTEDTGPASPRKKGSPERRSEQPATLNAGLVAASSSSSVCRMLARELVTNARAAAVMAEAIGRLPPCIAIGRTPSDASESDNIQNVDLLLGFLTLQTALIYKSLNGLRQLRQKAFSSLMAFALAIAQYLPSSVGLDSELHNDLLCRYGVLIDRATVTAPPQRDKPRVVSLDKEYKGRRYWVAPALVALWKVFLDAGTRDSSGEGFEQAVADWLVIVLMMIKGPAGLIINGRHDIYQAAKETVHIPNNADAPQYWISPQVFIARLAEMFVSEECRRIKVRVLKQKFEGNVAALDEALVDFNEGFDVICVNAEKAAHGDIIVLVHRNAADSRTDTMLILLFQCKRYMSTVLKRVDCRAELVKMGLEPTREDELWQIFGNEKYRKDELRGWLAARANQLGDVYVSALEILDKDSKDSKRIPRLRLQEHLRGLINASLNISLSPPVPGEAVTIAQLADRSMPRAEAAATPQLSESKSPRKVAASNAPTPAEAPVEAAKPQRLEQWRPRRNWVDPTSVISVDVHRVMFVYATKPEPMMATDVNAKVHFVYCKFGALFPIDVTSTSCSEQREYAASDDSAVTWTSHDRPDSEPTKGPKRPRE
jgi:hypothetical protein